MNHDLHDLAEEYLNGTLCDAGMSRLESLLQGDPKSKRDFVSHLVLHGQLSLVAEELLGTERLDVRLELTSRGDASRVARTRRIQRTVWQAIVATAAACSLFAVIWFSSGNVDSGNAKESAYDLSPIPIRTVGYVAGDRNHMLQVMAGSNASIARSTEMRTANGTTVNVVSESRFAFASETSGLLFRGDVLVNSHGSNPEYAVEMQNVRVVGRGARFRVQRKGDDFARIETLEGQVEIQTRVPVPRLYWSLDNTNHRDRQESGRLDLLLGDQVSRVPGLIGPGALHFEERSGAYATVVGGTEAKVGGGLFAMSGGMSIEAVISSTWDGADDNQDVIFRKEDGPNRILLSFQNNRKTENSFAFPQVPRGPVLSFGIFLRELGYSELDMPLDGKDGRPTVAQIADGKPHIIAATYDSFSGTKAIAIDGKVRFSHQFPIGHCIQSGGPMPAMIGGWRKRETFDGVIDELAIYDYALSGEEITRHHELARKGQHWFFDPLNEHPNWTTIQTIAAGNLHELLLSTFNKNPL
jgi:hypothetical protein